MYEYVTSVTPVYCEDTQADTERPAQPQKNLLHILSFQADMLHPVINVNNDLV